MSQDNRNEAANPEVEAEDPLTELLGRGARDLIKQAVEAELATFLDQYRDVQLPDGRQAVVRNGYQPERTIQTGIGEVPVQLSKVRDRSGNGIRFHSGLLPPYLRRTRSMEELIPWLYLKGISTGDFQEALQALLGEDDSGRQSPAAHRQEPGGAAPGTRSWRWGSSWGRAPKSADAACGGRAGPAGRRRRG